MPKAERKVTARQFTGDEFTLFTTLRDRFRRNRVDNIRDEQAVAELATAFKIPEDEAGAILAGQIPTSVDDEGKILRYDADDLARLYEAGASKDSGGVESSVSGGVDSGSDEGTDNQAA